MRRTRATTLLDAGVHPRIAQKMMRHANVETTMRYDRGNIDDATSGSGEYLNEGMAK